MHTCALTYVHMHLYYLQAHTSTHACNHMHACIYTHMHVFTHTCMYLHTHACMHTLMHACIHAHTHSNKQRTSQCFSPATANDYVDRLVPEVANSAVLVLQRQQGFPWQLAMQHEPWPTAQQVSATGLVRQTHSLPEQVGATSLARQRHLTWAGRRHKFC